MIRFEVTGQDVQEFRQQFAASLAVFLPMLKGPSPSPAEVMAEDARQQAKVEVEPEKPAKEPKAKAKGKQTDLEEKIAETPTIEDLRAKLQALGSKKDHETVFKTLEPYGVRKASELPPEKRAEVIATVDKLLEE